MCIFSNLRPAIERVGGPTYSPFSLLYPIHSTHQQTRTCTGIAIHLIVYHTRTTFRKATLCHRLLKGKQHQRQFSYAPGPPLTLSTTASFSWQPQPPALPGPAATSKCPPTGGLAPGSRYRQQHADRTQRTEHGCMRLLIIVTS